jgi:hypothetical protein
MILDKVMAIVDSMAAFGVAPNMVTYTTMLLMMSYKQTPNTKMYVEQVYTMMMKQCVQLDDYCMGALIAGLCKSVGANSAFAKIEAILRQLGRNDKAPSTQTWLVGLLHREIACVP